MMHWQLQFKLEKKNKINLWERKILSCVRFLSQKLAKAQNEKSSL